MKYLIILLIIVSVSCSEKIIYRDINYRNELVDNVFDQWKYDILGKDCSFVKDYVKYRWIPCEEKEGLYMMDGEMLQVLNFCDCFNGLTKLEVIEIFGSPTEKKKNGIRYHFLKNCLNDNSTLIGLEFSFDKLDSTLIHINLFNSELLTCPKITENKIKKVK